MKFTHRLLVIAFLVLCAIAGIAAAQDRCNPNYATILPPDCPRKTVGSQRPTQENRDWTTGDVVRNTQRVIFFRGSTRFSEIVAKRLQNKARVSLNDNGLVVVTTQPDPARVHAKTIDYTVYSQVTDSEYRDSPFKKIARDKIGSIGRGGIIGILADAGIRESGLSGQDITEYYYTEFKLQLGNHSLNYSGYAYFKVMARYDPYKGVTIRKLESIGSEESCWTGLNDVDGYPNFWGKLEVWALEVALRQASFADWINGRPPQFDPANPIDQLEEKKKRGACKMK